ncbi:MAG: hypothetical protein IIC46_12670, partial [Planctomycetes bacterium]|nr:hypothetical protein [Planctomycetota bacterium]
MRPTTLSIAAIALCTSAAIAQERENVQFQITHTPPNTAWSVYVLGDLPELGGNDLTRAVQLEDSEDPLWKVTVSLPVNRSFTYRFYERINNSFFIGDPENGEPIGEEINGETKSVALWPTTKKMHYHSSFDPPVLHWRQDDGAYQAVAMQEIGPGREPGEFRWLACSFGEARRPLEFYVTNVDETLRDPMDQDETYSTPLDALFLQDENIFSYVPAPSVTPQQRDYDPRNPPTIESKIIGEPRSYRVMLPRGYSDHPDRQYPVIYFDDGLIIWDNNKGLPPPMDLDGAIMAELIRQGKVGEVIMVGANNINTGCELLITRARDLVPPGDTVTVCNTQVPGEADLWAGFLISELKPLIDAQYRTLPDRDNTFISGFSFGGLNSMYNGWDFTETFGRIGSLSGSFWVPNFRNRIMDEPWRDIRIYMDSGTVSKESIYNSNRNVYSNFIGKSPQKYVVEGDLRYFVAFGQDHQFVNAGTRLPNMMTFLYPGTEEPNDALLCRADLDCSGSVGTSDLLALFAQWGTDGPADFDESG